MVFSEFSGYSKQKIHAVWHLGNRELISVIFHFGTTKVTRNSDNLSDVKEPMNIWQSLHMLAFTSSITYDHNHV